MAYIERVIILSIALIYFLVYAAPNNNLVPKSECRSQIDLVLVVDGSDSILREDYNTQRNALADMILEMEIKPNASRVGIVVYSTDIAESIPLSSNKTYLIEQARNLSHPQDGTKTHLGIIEMIKLFKHGRKNVPWACIVITDGQSKRPRQTAAQAKKARDMGVNMFAVGISHFIEETELLNIASKPDQVLKLQSFDQLQVTLSGLMKVVCPCPLPPPVKFGHVNAGQRAIGSSRSYVCDDGYQPMGNPVITCGKDAMWTTMDFSCDACPEPIPEFGFGFVTPGLQLLRTTREYVCGKGYTTPVPVLTTCVEGPNGPYWTTPDTTCSACGPVMEYENMFSDMAVTESLIGTTRQYHCHKGYIPTGPIETTCVDDKGIPKWTPPNHGCKACVDPPITPYAAVDALGNNLVGSIRVYTCVPGYHPTGPIEAVCMGENGAAFWKKTDHFCAACIEPPNLPNAVLNRDGDTLVGSVRTYVCLKGYQPTGPIEMRCSSGPGKVFWEGPHHKCVACKVPPVLPNAVLDPLGDTLIGSVRRYNCMNGYIPSGPIEVGCIKGTGHPLWTAAEFQCIACPPPPEVPYAVMDSKGNNLIGSRRIYHCVQGYIPSKPGPIVSECIGEYIKGLGRAFWSDPSHYCKTCPVPPSIEFAQIEGTGSNLIGSVRNYVCTKGFYASGPMSIKCMDDGQWSKPIHSCTACGPTPKVKNAVIDDGLHQLGTVRVYNCNPGYTHSATPEIVCLKNAQWSKVNFTCISCMNPYGLENAVLEPGNNLIGEVRRYTCLPGYLATGPITSTCALPAEKIQPDWSTPVHFCKDCGEPYPVENAIAVKGLMTIGAVQQYLCKAGYVPSAPPLAHCMPNAEWTPPEFKCIGLDHDESPSKNPEDAEYKQSDTPTAQAFEAPSPTRALLLRVQPGSRSSESPRQGITSRYSPRDRLGGRPYRDSNRLHSNMDPSYDPFIAYRRKFHPGFNPTRAYPYPPLFFPPPVKHLSKYMRKALQPPPPPPMKNLNKYFKTHPPNKQALVKVPPPPPIMLPTFKPSKYFKGVPTGKHRPIMPPLMKYFPQKSAIFPKPQLPMLPPPPYLKYFRNFHHYPMKFIPAKYRKYFSVSQFPKPPINYFPGLMNYNKYFGRPGNKYATKGINFNKYQMNTIPYPPLGAWNSWTFSPPWIFPPHVLQKFRSQKYFFYPKYSPGKSSKYFRNMKYGQISPFQKFRKFYPRFGKYS